MAEHTLSPSIVPDLDDEDADPLPFNPESHTVDELRERVADVDDVEVLRAVRNLEAEQRERSTALEAIDDRIEDLEEE